MVNHLTRDFLIRGIIFISIVIIIVTWYFFGDLPFNIYWIFIISVNITYHTMEYIIRLRRERDEYRRRSDLYKTSYEAMSEIASELGATTKEALRYADNTEFLAQFDNEEDLI